MSLKSFIEINKHDVRVTAFVSALSVVYLSKCESLL